MKILKRFFVLLYGMLFSLLIFPVAVSANSGVIQFSSQESEVVKGSEFTVICELTSSDAFLDVEFPIVYDADVLRFVKGGKKVSGKNGVLRVNSSGNESSTTKKTFSLQFVAKKKGVTSIAVEGEIKVTDEEGSLFSVSSNELMISVVKKRSVTSEEDGTDKPDGVQGKLPKDVVHPEDTPAPTPTLTPTPVPTEEPTQKPKVTKKPKMTEEPTDLGESPSNVVKDIAFGVVKDGDKTLLKNSYEFEVLDPSQVEDIPAGYIQTNIKLGGVTIPAYTMEKDLDNNYLLLYLKGPSEKNTWYQYDREEKTLQRYTGEMIKKVNQDAGSAGLKNSDSGISYVAFGIIIFLVIIILCMMIAMLKMAMKKKEF